MSDARTRLTAGRPEETEAPGGPTAAGPPAASMRLVCQIAGAAEYARLPADRRGLRRVPALVGPPRPAAE